VAITFVTFAFIASYAGALHSPKPHGVPIAVAATVPPEVLTALKHSPALSVRRVDDAAAATRSINRRETYGAITLSAKGFVLTTAPAASTGVATLLKSTLPQELRATGQPFALVTAHPLPEADEGGLVGFYTVIAWVIAGYLWATLFGLTFGTQARRTALRLGALAAIGLVIGLGGTLTAKAIGDVPVPWLSLTLLGALVITTTGAFTVAMQSLLGVAGTGVAMLLFVIVGNPSSGGPVARELLPAFWRDVGQLIPNGAGVSAFRDMAYFPDAPLTTPLLTLLIWLLLGVIVALLLGERARPVTQADANLAAASAAAP
jgi:hypothetical protein